MRLCPILSDCPLLVDDPIIEGLGRHISSPILQQPIVTGFVVFALSFVLNMFSIVSTCSKRDLVWVLLYCLCDEHDIELVGSFGELATVSSSSVCW